jgi:hypothetical protein
VDLTRGRAKLTHRRAKLTRGQRRTPDLPTSFANALRALAQRVHISMSRFAGHGKSSLPIFVVRCCYHRTIPMMRFAAYYSFHYWPQFELAAYNANCRELFRFEPILMVRYRWPHSQASEMPLWGPGPGQISLVLQKHPNGVYGPKPGLYSP